MENETLPITPSTNWSKILLFILLGTIIIGASIVVGIQIEKNQTSTQQPNVEQSTILPTQKEDNLTALPSEAITASPTDSSINCPSLDLPVVVFGSPLSKEQNPSKNMEIQKKVVNPYVDYFKHTSKESPLLSLLIQQQNNENLNDQYPYSLVGIFSNGVNSWESLMQTGGELDWWIPTCMEKCDYSEEFIQKYPEIVSKTD